MKSYGSCVFQYLRATSDICTWATADTRRIRRVRIIWVMNATGQRSKFSLLAPLSLLSSSLPLARREKRRSKDDISWNNTAIIDSIRFLPLIFLSQILPIWILLRYDDTAFRSRKEGRKEGRIVTRNERDGETLKGISYSFFLSRLKKKLGNNSIFFDQPRPFLTSWCWKKKVNILFEVKLLKEGNFFLSLSYTFGIQSNTI